MAVVLEIDLTLATGSRKTLKIQNPRSNLGRETINTVLAPTLNSHALLVTATDTDAAGSDAYALSVYAARYVTTTVEDIV